MDLELNKEHSIPKAWFFEDYDEEYFNDEYIDETKEFPVTYFVFNGNLFVWLVSDFRAAG